MKPKTMVLMVVAVGCGLGASYMTSRLLADRQAVAPAEQQVPVLVAKIKVPGWTPIKEPEKFFEVKMQPESMVSKKSLRGFEDVKDQRLNKPLDAERTAMQDDLLSKEQQSLVDSLTPGQRAVAIKVNAESLAGGFVLQGSRVDVLMTTRGSEGTSKMVLQSMLVLAVDQEDKRNTEKLSTLGNTVTLGASPEEAARLSLAQSIGELRLLPKNHADNKRLGQVIARVSDLDKPLPPSGSSSEPKAEGSTPVPVEAPTQLPPVPEAPAVVQEAPKADPVEKPRKRHVMTLINGTQREKAVFVEGEGADEDDAPPPAPAPAAKKADEAPAKKDEAKKDEAKKDEKTKPAAPGTNSLRTPRTRSKP